MVDLKRVKQEENHNSSFFIVVIPTKKVVLYTCGDKYEDINKR